MPPFDADTERLDTIPVWVHLPGSPWELWNLASLSDIGKDLGTFIEVDLSYQQMKIRKVVRILVSLNIRTSLREYFTLTWQTKTKKQMLDYEGLPFHCHKCHETIHLGRNYPNYVPTTSGRKKWVRRTGASSSKENILNLGLTEEHPMIESEEQSLDRPKGLAVAVDE